MKRIIPPQTLLNDQVCIAFVDNVLILLTSVERWTESDNEFLMEKFIEVGGIIEKPSLLCHYFGEPYGGKASHRKQLADWQEARGINPTERIASLTDSVLMRGAMTAYSWIVKTEVKPFKPDDLITACNWLVEGQDTSAESIINTYESCRLLLEKRAKRLA